MLFLGFVLALRVPQSVIDTTSLPYLDASEHVSFLKSHERSVIIYDNESYILSFLEYPIIRYHNRIGFAFANQSLAPSSCAKFPCLIGYDHEIPLTIGEPAFSPVLFTTWCERVLRPYDFRLSFYEEIAATVRRTEPCLFAIDIDERPDNVPRTVEVFHVALSALQPFNFSIGLTKGLYVYRPKDHQLLPYKGKWDEEIKTPLKTGEDSYGGKEFLAGTYFGPDARLHGPQVEILLNLSQKFNDKVDFFLLNREDKRELIDAGVLSRMDIPFFFVFKSKNISAGRWYVQGPDSLNYSIVEPYLSEVVSGKLPYAILHAIITPEPEVFSVKQVNALTVEAAISNQESIRMLLAASTICPQCRRFKPVVRVAADVSRDKNLPIKWYWFDGVKNDFPDCLPKWAQLPALYCYLPHGNLSEPSHYLGGYNVTQVLEFVQTETQLQFEIPDFNHTELAEVLARYYDEDGPPVPQPEFPF